MLNVVFLVTSLFVYTRSDTAQVSKPPIKEFFEHIENYKTVRHIPLDDQALPMLKLDDYLYADYEGPDGKVNLYIGYYYTANKAYASHSPLVCYPSQGWKIEGEPSHHILNAGSHRINYDEITTSLIKEKELVLYWYQAHHQTNRQIVQNKIDMGYNKLMNNSEQHAFVRVSVPFDNNIAYDQAKQSAVDFIEAFYPQFIDFVDVRDLTVR